MNFSGYAFPRTYVEGLSVEFIADNGTETSSMVGRAVESTDRRFSATVSIHLTDSISLSALFVYPDGTQQTQLLDTYSYLYTNSMSMDANIVDSDLQGKASYENGVLTLLPTDFAAEVIQYDDSVLPETASPASVKLGLFKNRQLIAWAEELDAQPDSFHGFEGYTFYCTPKSYVPCTPGDIFSAAVLITDQFGRQLICEAISGTYVLAEDGTLEWAPDDYHSNAPPSDWIFGRFLHSPASENGGGAVLFFVYHLF